MNISLPTKLIFGIAISFVTLFIPQHVTAQEGITSIYFSPNQGTFEVESTFDVSVFLNTGDSDINTIQLDLAFSADSLQVVKPTTGKSFISIWITQPSFSNTEGRLSLQGGLPSPGINTSAGLITTITFRAVSSGYASIQVLDSSRVLANDGHGTDLPISSQRAQYIVSIPPPEGPTVVSSTHPDQNKWYRNNNIVLSWKLEFPVALQETLSQVLDQQAVQYSWVFDQDPLNIPDNDVEGKKTMTSYENIKNGKWYFHIKALMSGIWGNTTHYIVQIDNKPPAEFLIQIEPKNQLESIRRFVYFLTTDEHSGVDYYGIKIESITGSESYNTSFIEAASPWQIPSLSKGSYKVLVRAYDKAGNFQDSESQIDIRTDIFTFLRYEGIHMGSVHIPWIVLLIPFIFAIVILVRFLLKLRKRKLDPSSQFEEYIEKSKKKVQKKQEEYLKEKNEQEEIEDLFNQKYTENQQKEEENSSLHQVPQDTLQ